MATSSNGFVLFINSSSTQHSVADAVLLLSLVFGLITASLMLSCRAPVHYVLQPAPDAWSLKLCSSSWIATAS